jgi:hypothetical protein
MKDKLFTWGLRLIWTAAGELGRELAAWIAEASTRGLTGREAFEFVWRKAKARYTTIGDWLLNLLIETAVGQAKLKAGSAALKWPSAS